MQEQRCPHSHSHYCCYSLNLKQSSPICCWITWRLMKKPFKHREVIPYRAALPPVMQDIGAMDAVGDIAGAAEQSENEQVR
jgi:hypothetical protein